MAVRRASSAAIAISPQGARQADFATATATAALTALLPDTAKSFYRKEQTREDVLDCSGQELYKRLLTGEIGDISIEFNASAKLVALLAAYEMGVAAAPVGVNPYTHALGEIPLDAYQPPLFSLVFGFRGGATPLLLRACAMNSLGLRGARRGIVTGAANIKFAEAVPAAGFVFPACLNDEPLRVADCSLTAGGAAVDGLRSFDFSHSNKILTGDHAFTNESVLATRFERDDRRERRLSYVILGDNSDLAYTEAEAGAEMPLALTIGTGNNRVTFNAPRTQVELDGGGLRKDGQAGETNIALVGTPLIDGAQMPVGAVAVNDQATAYLLAA